jgi:hypothetical protein
MNILRRLSIALSRLELSAECQPTTATTSNGEDQMLEKLKAEMDAAMSKLEAAIAAMDNEAAKIHAHIVRALHDLL